MIQAYRCSVCGSKKTLEIWPFRSPPHMLACPTKDCVGYCTKISIGAHISDLVEGR